MQIATKNQATMLRIFILVLLLSTASAIDSNTYVVHMDKAKMKALDASLGESKRWYEEVIESINVGEEEEEPPKLLYVYENVIYGFSAKLSSHHLESITRIDGFLSSTIDELLTLHTTHSPHFLGLMEGIGLWDAQNLAADVIIGVVDTGIWPEHRSFSGSGYPPVPSRWRGKCQPGPKFPSSKCNKKVIGASAFFKGYEAIAGRINETLDYRSPRDSQGHGSHTASTAGGNLVKGASLFNLAKGKASGMRYTSRIAAYKACFQLGCASSDLVAAIDQAVSDGVDVLSLSLGGFTRPFYLDTMAIAAFGAMQKGVFVSSSAGNSGPTRSSVSNTAPWMATVAASYMDRAFPTELRLGDGQVFKGAALYSGRPTKKSRLVYGENAGGSGARFCTSNTLSPTLIKGKIVICDRGVNSRVEKGENVKIGGGAGMIVANAENTGEELIADAHVLPATSIGASAAKALKKYLNSTTDPTCVIKFRGTVYNDDPSPVAAAFSSRGPSLFGPDVIKPDITAPGVNILAAWPPISPTGLKTDKRRVRFNVVSGTSMSCPHISGIAALLKSKHQKWSPAAIKSALMTTAYIQDSQGLPIQDAASNSNTSSNNATPFAFGSGHVDPTKAADPGLIYDISDQDYLIYLCSLNYNSTQIALFSKGNFTCPNGSHFQQGDLNYPSFAVQFNTSSTNSTANYRRTVTNVGDAVSTYGVRVSEPEGVKIIVRPKVLNFRKVGERVSYEVSFLAKGSVVSSDFSFGSVVWVSSKHYVRSPIAVTWL